MTSLDNFPLTGYEGFFDGIIPDKLVLWAEKVSEWVHYTTTSIAIGYLVCQTEPGAYITYVARGGEGLDCLDVLLRWSDPIIADDDSSELHFFSCKL